MNFNFKFILLSSFILFGLVFSSCSTSIDCSAKDTKYEKFTLNSSTNLCEVSKTVERDICGNNVFEEGETFCNCPKDVDKLNPEFGCSGSVGDYAEFACANNNKCSLFETQKVISQTKAIVFKNSDLTINSNFEIKNPYVLGLSKESLIKVKSSLFKTNSNKIKINNILVKSITIFDSSNNILANVDYNEQIFRAGDNLADKSFPLKKTSSYESKVNLKPSLVVTYTKQTINSKGEVVKEENKIETLKASIGNWKVINPDFK